VRKGRRAEGGGAREDKRQEVTKDEKGSDTGKR